LGDGAGPLAGVCLVCVAAGHVLSRDLTSQEARRADSGVVAARSAGLG